MGTIKYIYFRLKEDKQIILRRPYFSTDLREGEENSEESQCVHPFPQLLWLAIVLMQLMLAEKMEQLASRKEVEVGSAVNDAQWIAKGLLEECERRFPSKSVLGGIRKCIHLTFKPANPRHFVYLHLVLPLEKFVLETTRHAAGDAIRADLSCIFLSNSDQENAALSDRPRITSPKPARRDPDNRCIASTTTRENTSGEIVYSVVQLEDISQFGQDAQNR